MSLRRRIVLVTETFTPDLNGVATTLRHLCTELLDRGHEVMVVRTSPARRRYCARDFANHTQYREIVVPGLPLFRYPDLRMGLPAGRLLRRLWQKNKPDAVYLATQGPLGRSALKVARELGVVTCSGFHTNFHLYSHYYGVGFLDRAIGSYLIAFHNRCDATLVPTRRTSDRVTAMGVERVHLWSRGVDCERFGPFFRCQAQRRGWGLAENDLAVMYVGRLAAEKNLTQAVASFERLKGIYPRSRFILVGDGPLRQSLQSRHPDYIFTGSRNGADLARHYASGDILLFPSKTDTFGNVVIEAMASGLAVVAFDEGAAAEHIQDSTNGMKVAVDTSEAFTRAVLRLADSVSLRTTIRQAARRTALKLSWSVLVRQFEEIAFRPRKEVHRHGNEQSLSTF